LKDTIEKVDITNNEGKFDKNVLFKYSVLNKNNNPYLIISQKDIPGFEHNHRIYKRSISNTDTD